MNVIVQPVCTVPFPADVHYRLASYGISRHILVLMSPTPPYFTAGFKLFCFHRW